MQPAIAEAHTLLLLGRSAEAEAIYTDLISRSQDAVQADHGQFFTPDPRHRLFDPDAAGGALLDLGIYPVSLALHLFGEPRSVLATGIVLDPGADGQGTILLGYPGFEVACLHSKIVPCAVPSEIAGELGVLTLDDCSVPTELTLHHRLGAPGEATGPAFHRASGWTESIAREQSAHHMRYEIAHFAELVREGAAQSDVHPASRSLAALRILDEARAQVFART